MNPLRFPPFWFWLAGVSLGVSLFLHTGELAWVHIIWPITILGVGLDSMMR